MDEAAISIQAVTGAALLYGRFDSGSLKYFCYLQQYPGIPVATVVDCHILENVANLFGKRICQNNISRAAASMASLTVRLLRRQAI
jgi:hypothetical protein